MMKLDFDDWNIHVGAPHPFNARAVPKIDNGTERPDPRRYHDPDFMREEWDKVFARSWLLAGPASDIPEAGDFFTFTIGPESFIVVRGEDGVIRAHYNVCPHRGSRLVTADFGSMDRFTCPFHSWKFDLEGRNLAVTDEETFRPEVLCHGHDLTSVRCEVAVGLVFICMDTDVAPLSQWLAPILPQLELYDIDKMYVVQHRRSDWGPTGRAASMPSRKPITSMPFIRRHRA
ncbi:aromatic ring-hydroxylating oxygenase subunit alpha [Novosphingobium panipatense]|uniref:aromatic ring-hydroxylating oxygenase subunit alpha n=1 Tax=Novosphingobium panipatense TaxID=428991 RepID=UPI00361BB4CB